MTDKNEKPALRFVGQDDQKNIDELVAAGIQVDKEEIARLRAEVAGLRTGYEAYERVNAELKAENEALRESDQDSTELCDTLSALLGEIAVAVRGPEEPKTRHGFHDLPSRVKAVVSDRNQNKAEVVALLKALDVAAARMIAAKACFDRDYPGEWSGELHLAVAIKEIDAAMGKGEKS